MEQEGGGSHLLDVVIGKLELSEVHVVQEKLQTPSRSVPERYLSSPGFSQTACEHGLDTNDLLFNSIWNTAEEHSELL